MPTTIRSLLCAALVLIAAAAAPALAKDGRYPLDWAIASCKDNGDRYLAIAVSDFGSYWCSWDFSSLEETRREAVRGCKGNLPPAVARGANCAVIYENGQIVDKPRAALMRKDVKLPVRIESVNGQTGETEMMKGFITLGAAPDERTRTARITLADGTAICVGAARLQRLTTKFGFTATCFGDQKFKGEARVTGLVKAGGLNRLGFDLLIKNPPHRARIVTLP